MSIIQISKIQQRSGNLVDLPQLDEAEFGWASDAKRLFIGKTTPNENVEVLTSYSQINFSQINGSVGNLNISNVTVANGQALIYDGTNWVNRGGNVGGLITLGDVSNVKITGGAIGYVLETDGLGNLSWTPKSTIVAYIQNVTKANPAVVTTTQDNFLTDGLEVTITDASGMTQLNGDTYYANVLTSNTFSLYSDPSLTTGIDTSATITLSSVTITGTAGQFGCSASSSPLSVGQEVTISGTFGGTGSISGYSNPTTYYIVATNGSTTFTLSTTKGGAGVTTTAGTPTGLTYTVSLFSPYSFTTAASTSASTNRVTIGNSALFAVNQEVLFLGDLSTSGIELNTSYYIKSVPSGTTITLSEELLANGVAGNTKSLTTATLTGANVYAAGGRAIASVGGAGGTSLAAYGSTDMIQYNVGGLLRGNGSFTFNEGSSLLSLTGNANVGNLNATGIVTSTRMISNVATGVAPPLAVSSTDRVANLNVSYSNVTDFSVVTNQTTGTFYPVFASSSATGNRALGANANISFNAATGNLSVVLLNVTSNANVGNLGTAGLIVATGNVTGGNLVTGGEVAATGNVSGGNLTTGGVVAATGNVTGGNLVTGGALAVTGNANVGNLGTARVIATGNISGTQLISNIATGTAPLVVTSTTTVANLAAATATTAGTVTTAAQPNITSVGTLTGLTISTATGRLGFGTDGGGVVSIGLIDGNSSTPYIDFNTSNTAVDYNVRLMATGAATGVGAGTLTASAATFAIGNALTVGTTATVTGNANVGNLGTAGLIVATGNVTGGNLTTAGVVAATGNVSGGNLTTAGVVAATGNVSGGNLTTAGALSVTGNANVGNLGTAGLVVATGNVTGGNLVTGGVISVTGNANVGNLGTAGLVVATGNVSGGNLVTGGALSVTGNANVGNIGATTAIFTTGNITTINSGLLQNGTSNVVVAASGGNVTLGVAGTARIIATSTGANITGTGNITGNANVGNLGTAGLVVATGNVTGGNLVTGGAVVATGNVSGSGLFIDGLANITGNAIVGGVVAATGNVSGANVVVTSYHIRSINGAVSAAGTNQGTATALTKEISVVSTVATGAGVVLPTAVAGMVLIINNTSANTLNVYPASGGAVNSGSTNAAYSHTSGASIQYYATSGTQWYTVGATFS
jgi:hypothetical protein